MTKEEIETLRNCATADVTDPVKALAISWLFQKHASELLALAEEARPRIEALREALLRIATSSHCAYDGQKHYGPDSDGSRSYDIGVADGHRCAASDARYALDTDTERSGK